MKKISGQIFSRLSRRELYLIIVLLVVLLGLILSAGLMMTQQLTVTLQGEGEVQLYCGQPFSDPGAVASVRGKPVDVTITGNVNLEVPGTYTLSYYARYLMTSETVYRTVRVIPVSPSVMTLLGVQEVFVEVGSNYQEPGFTAVDCLGNDVSDRVQIIGQVDTERCGSYVLTYSVAEAAGNVTSMQRTVTVKPVQQPVVVQPNGKVIYLTFDDGPSAHTQKLLDILKRYNAKATFFVVNTGHSNAGDLMRAIVADGHAIGIHSMSHNYEKIYASEENFLKDMYAIQDLIKKETGVETKLMRFPGGASNAISKNYCKGIMTALVQRVTELGFRYFDWNVESLDAGGAKTADAVYENVTGSIKQFGFRNTFVLQHDTKPYSVDAVERILQWGIANGYSFQALTMESPACQHQVSN